MVIVCVGLSVCGRGACLVSVSVSVTIRVCVSVSVCFCVCVGVSGACISPSMLLTHAPHTSCKEAALTAATCPAGQRAAIAHVRRRRQVAARVTWRAQAGLAHATGERPGEDEFNGASIDAHCGHAEGVLVMYAQRRVVGTIAYVVEDCPSAFRVRPCPHAALYLHHTAGQQGHHAPGTCSMQTTLILPSHLATCASFPRVSMRAAYDEDRTRAAARGPHLDFRFFGHNLLHVRCLHTRMSTGRSDPARTEGGCAQT